MKKIFILLFILFIPTLSANYTFETNSAYISTCIETKISNINEIREYLKNNRNRTNCKIRNGKESGTLVAMCRGDNELVLFFTEKKSTCSQYRQKMWDGLTK